MRELQSHCDQGLQHLSFSSGQNFLQLGMPLYSRYGHWTTCKLLVPPIQIFSSVVFELCCRAADALISDKDLAVRAAAASIYSTCNFLASEENITCTWTPLNLLTSFWFKLFSWQPFLSYLCKHSIFHSRVIHSMCICNTRSIAHTTLVFSSFIDLFSLQFCSTIRTLVIVLNSMYWIMIWIRFTLFSSSVLFG